MKYFLIICLLLLPDIMSAQSQPNYNLVTNPTFDDVNLSANPDTAYEQNGCWVRANRSLLNVSLIGSLGSIYNPQCHSYYTNWDTIITGLELSNNMHGIKFVASTRAILDSNLNPAQRPLTTDYAQNRLLKPLTAGTTYTFTMYLYAINIPYPATNSYCWAKIYLKNIGVYFSNTPVMDYVNYGRINVTPQINFPNWSFTKTDTAEAIKLTGQYTASGGEQFMTIGNFDYIKDYKISTTNYVFPYDTVTVVDSFSMRNFGRGPNFIFKPSLVADTTRPMISLSEFSLGDDTTICPGQRIQLGGQPYFFHYWWNTGDTTRFINTSVPGTYWCSVDYGCGNRTDTIKITNSPAPVAFNLPDTSLCTGPIVIQAPAGFVGYLWSNGATSASVLISAQGRYWVRATNTCGQSVSDTFTVADPPRAYLNIPDTVLCQGQTIIVKAPPGFAGYQWSNGTTTDATAINTQGRYWLRIIDACSQSATDTFQIRSEPSVVPGININAIPPTILCEGTPITFVINQTGGGSNPAYQWYKNGIPLPGQTAPTYLDAALVSGDTLTVAMHSSANCPVTQPTISNHLGVTVSPVLIPGVSISAGTMVAGQPITFTATPVNGGISPGYIWWLNGNIVPGVSTSSWTTTSLREGDYVTVSMESKVYCPQPAVVTSNVITVHYNLGVPLDNTNATKVYPNPATEKLTIEGAGDCTGYMVNSVGQRVLNFGFSSNKETLNISLLNPGIYLLCIQHKDGSRQLLKFTKR